MNLYAFYRDAFRVLEPQTEFMDNWHGRFIAGVLQTEAYRIAAGQKSRGDIVINVPFRSSKSLLTTIVFPVWAWTISPHMSFITASFSNQLSTEHARKSRQLIQSDWFQQHFGQAFSIVTDQNVKSNYENDKGGKRFATSVGGSVTGMGADVIILDDPLNPKMAYSDVERENVNRSYRETFYSRTKNPHTAVRIAVMQRLHEDDLSGLMLREGDARHVCIPAELTDDVQPKRLRDMYVDGLFWNERFTREILDKYKTSLGSVGYAGQMLQKPSPPQGAIFKRDWFQVVDELPRDVVWNFKIDPAFTSKQENDPSAILAYCEIDGHFYFRNVVQKWMEFPQLCQYIREFTMANGYTEKSRIWVEPKASGKSIVQQLRGTTGLNILEDVAPDVDKVTRANAVSAIVESGRVKLIRGAWNSGFIDEAVMFPNAKHDDRVDVMVMALQGIRKKQFVIL